MHRQSFSPQHIEYFERDFLDNYGGVLEDSALQTTRLGNTDFLRIRGLASFWELKQRDIFTLRLLMEDIISGLYESNVPFIFSVLGTENDVEIIMGVYCDAKPTDSNMNILTSALTNSFHGVEIESLPSDYLQQKVATYQKCGLLTGTPSEKKIDGRITVSNIERLLRGAYGKNCAYIVVASPLDNKSINILYNSILNEMRIIIDTEKHLKQENPTGRRYTELLGEYLKKLQTAKAQGLWNTVTLLYADNQESLNQLKAISKSTFSGRESVPDRIRTFNIKNGVIQPGLITNPSHQSPGQFTWPYSFMNILNTSDLANQVQLPDQELPGFVVKPYARFNVSVDKSRSDGIGIGEVLDQNQRLGYEYKVSLKGLKKHGLIVGTTGSGKTNTLFYMLKEMWNRGTPFLVLEPAKTEYRKLIHSDLFKDDMRVFTLGDNNVSPFRINPFEVLPGILVQTHIDLLKSVFNASFFMWGPLPHVLERCLHEIYTDKGWDLNSNTNTRGDHRNANPTLSDLYNKVDDVVDSLGYSPETTMELTSSLKTRINSLRIGGKGLMLDTRSSIDFVDLLSKPTILELETLGDDEEKSFIMGLVLTMMYEYYISQGFSEGMDLSHITVIEEAHRLLANAAPDNQYSGNMKGKAVETFTNILSEIRAYGEGFLIAEQIPTKLSSDVIKNTNLKIMHRIVSEDDRKIMTATMNIDDKDSKKVTSLGIGEAVVYSEGDDGAYNIQVPYAKLGEDPGDDESAIKTSMTGFRENPEYISPYTTCTAYCKSICQYKNLGEIIHTRSRFHSTMDPLTLASVEETGYTDTLLIQMFEEGNDEARKVEDPLGVKTCAIIQSAERYYEDLGRKYNWNYGATERLKTLFLDDYVASLKHYLSNNSELPEDTEFERFREYYKQLCEGKQPTQLCSEICSDNLCLYRYLLEDTLNDDYYHDQFVEIINEGSEDMWSQLWTLCKEAAENILPDGGASTHGKISLCYAMQKSYEMSNFSKRHIDNIVHMLINQYEEEVET